MKFEANLSEGEGRFLAYVLALITMTFLVVVFNDKEGPGLSIQSAIEQALDKKFIPAQ